MPYGSVMSESFNSKPPVLGLTGGIGAGKSTITSYLRLQDVPVFDCDAHVASLYSDAEFVEKLEEEFGPLGENPKATMALKVVQHPTLLDVLKSFFGPSMVASIQQFRDHYADREVVVIDAPVLFEHGLNHSCDFVVTVSTPENIRRERVMSRPGMTTEKLDLILSRQWTDQQRNAKADFVIYNVSTKEDAERQMAQVLQDIKRKTNVPTA